MVGTYREEVLIQWVGVGSASICLVALQREHEELAQKRAAANDGTDDPARTAAAAAAASAAARQELASAGGAPALQVQVIDGRIVVNESSLTAAASTREDTGAYRRVEESASRLNSRSYSNWTKAERWTPADTALWYKALKQFGSDFGLIQRLFPSRTRRQVKSKFRAEEKLHPRRIASALNYRTDGQAP
eukprot:jgi/Mesen1/9322/ME000061S08768